jgi:hypothetical protein
MKNPKCYSIVGNANPMKVWAAPVCLQSPNSFGLRELAVVPQAGASDIVGAGRKITHEKISSTVVEIDGMLLERYACRLQGQMPETIQNRRSLLREENRRSG